MKDAEQAPGKSLRTFYARRFLRIFPLYYLALAILWLWNVPLIRAQIGWHGTYLTNVLVARAGRFGVAGGMQHFWSLAVEEQFYLLWPLAVLLLTHSTLRKVIYAMIAGALLYRITGRFIFHWSYVSTHVLLVGCTDALGLGALIAMQGEAAKRQLRVLGYLFIPMLVAIMFTQEFGRGIKLYHAFFEFSAAVTSAVVVQAAITGIRGIPGRALSNPAVKYIGAISYGLYVYHLPILKFVTHRSWLAVPLTVAVASGSWFLFEKPINDLKKHFPYVQKARRAASAGM